MALASCEDVPAPYELNIDPAQPGVSAAKPMPWSSSSLNDFSVFTEEGVAWSLGNTYAKATGYNSSDKSYTKSTSWLISPAFNTTAESGKAFISFKYELHYASKLMDNHKVYATDAYTGNPLTTSWLELPVALEANSGSTWNFDYEAAVALPSSLVNCDSVFVSFFFTCPADNSSTWELEDFMIAEGEPGDKPAAADISNTPETAYTVSQANALITAGQGLSTKVYVKGTVKGSPDIDTSYGNATYYITDGTEDLEIYRGYSLGGAKFTSKTEIKAGDELIVYGQLVNYNGTYEFTTGSQIYSKNGETSGTTNPDTPDTPPTGSVNELRFDSNVWGLPEGSANGKTATESFTNGTHTIKLTAGSDGKYYFNTQGYLMLGKKDATLELPAFDFPVASIEVEGRKDASASTLQNIYVGSTAVSTETKGAQTTNVFNIKEGYRAAGTIYTLRVNSAHNSQIVSIKVIPADGTDVGGNPDPGTDPDTPDAEGYSIDFKAGQGDWTIQDVKLSDGVSYVWSQDSKYGMKATAYVGGSNHEAESWLISPAIKVITGVFKFREAANFFTLINNLDTYTKVMVQVAGTDTWTELHCTRGASGTSWTFGDSQASLAEYAGQSIRIAFVYSSNSTICGTWEIDNLTVQ